ncbi:MAG: PAS domain S-box protein [Sedimentisphaerales bacterium]|nr:PAS domain S-box protein [Sedimentisphaerales bacterium]
MKRNGDKVKQLKLSEIKYKALFDNMSSGVAIYQAWNDGEDFIFVDFNRAAARIDKINKEDLIGKGVLEVFPNVKDFGLFEVFQRVWKTGKPEHYPVSQYKDERIVGWRENYVYKLPSGEIVAIYDDITKRKQSEMALRMSEQCFHAVADYSCFWEIWVNPDGRPIWTNPAAHQITGYYIKEIMAMQDYPMPLVHEKDQARVARAFRSALNGGSGKEFQFRIRRKDGSVIWAEMSWQPICDEKSIPIGHRASIRDITKRRYAEQRYETIIQTALDGFWICDKSGHILDVNDSLCNMLGYNREELLDMSICDIDVSETTEQTNSHIEKVLKSQYSCFETRHRCKDGRVIDVEVSANYVDVEEGQFFASFRDITSRKKNEEALQKSEEKYRTLLRNIPQKIFYKDLNSVYVLCNDSYASDLNIQPDEIKGKTDYDFYPKELAVKYRKDDIKIMQSGNMKVIEEEYAKDGVDLIVRTLKAPIKDVKGNTIGLLGIFWEITEHKRAEQALYKLNKELEAKNEELESILYAASHDLKSPLVNIQGFSHELSQSCELIRLASKSNDKTAQTKKTMDITLNKNIPDALNFILASTTKMDSLLTGLLDVCRLHTAATDVKQIDMNAMMSNITASMEYQIKESAAKIDVEDLPPCVGDPSQINRVFSNLLTNALKFLDESRPAQIRIYGKTQNDKSIYCVEDNGIGIIPEHQGKIFQIFYQLEPNKRKGEGIGLTIVRRIIEKHDGKVWVESELGKGSKFFVSLPSD